MTVEWAVQQFKEVAQDLIIAHPFVSVSIVTKPLDELGVSNLLQLGITGIEVYHDSTSNKQIDSLKEMVNELAIHYTGGSDFHGNKKDTPIGQYGPNVAIPDFYLSGYRLTF